MQMLLLLHRKSWSNVPILYGGLVGCPARARDAKSNSSPNMDLQLGRTSEDTMIGATQRENVKLTHNSTPEVMMNK